MKRDNLSAFELVAACGINCSICLGYLRQKNKCEGCRSAGTHKPHHCFICSIKNCENLKETQSGFCYDCIKYPCARIKQLDKRYRLKYKMSIVENMHHLKTLGLKSFVDNEKVKWLCKTCGGTICVHRGVCLNCNA